MLFVLKITLTPILVALVSLAARRWGPAAGGLIMGLPWMTGPVLFFLGLEKGTAFVAQACTGVLLGVAGIAAYVLAYVTSARRTGWPLSAALALAAFVLAGSVTSRLLPPLEGAAGLGVASLLGAFLLLPRPEAAHGLRLLPWWDIPMRMAATAALVTIISLSADLLGPEISGLVATYPVILTVVGAFTHHHWGWQAVAQLTRGVCLSLLSFVAFFLVVGATVETQGLVVSYMLASAAALAMSAGLVGLQRRT